MKDFSEKFWEDMQRKLDQEMPLSFYQKPTFKYGLVSFVSGAVLMTVIFYFTIPKSPVTQPKRAQDNLVGQVQTSQVNTPEQKANHSNHIAFDDQPNMQSISSFPQAEEHIQPSNASFGLTASKNADAVSRPDFKKDHPTSPAQTEPDNKAWLETVLHEEQSEQCIEIISKPANEESESNGMFIENTQEIEPEGTSHREIEQVNKKVEGEEDENRKEPIKPQNTKEEMVLSDTVLVVDSISGMIVTEELPEVETKKTRGRLFVALGLNITKGFSNTKKTGEVAYNPVIGLGYALPLSTRWSVTLAATYMQRGGSKLMQESVRIEYFLDREASSMSAETFRIDYLNIPIQAGYLAGKRHRIQAGVYLAYVLDSRSKVVHSYTNSLGTFVTEETTSGGYVNGLNRLTYGLNAAYWYVVTPRVDAGILFRQGLNDATVNKIYNSSSNDLNQDLQVVLKYHLFK